MDLLINNQLFLLGGASSGFGRAVAETLVAEGANIIAVARREDKLIELKQKYPGQVEILVCDITQENSMESIVRLVGNRQLHGILVNAGGPPAMTALEAALTDWDNAYKTLLRWKVDLLQRLAPAMIDKKYGRVVFIESAAVKQPIENLALSNSIRLAVVGYAKTLSQEISKLGVTINVLTPSYHVTPAMDRIVQKKYEQTGISREDATEQFIATTSVGFLGKTTDFASLCAWVFSPHSRFITGQTISVDGGVIKGTMG